MGDARLTTALARVFIIPIAWLIMSVPARRYSERQHSKHWFVVSIVLFLLGLTVWLAHQQLYERWTCYSDVLGERFVHGRSFTREAIEARKFRARKLEGREITAEQAAEELRSIRPCTLIDGSEKDPSRVWTPDEIKSRKLVISAVYILGLPTFVMALIAAVQAWYCAGRPEAT